MKALLIILVLAAALGFGGKFFLEKKYEDQLDKIIAFSGSYANFGYDKVEIGFDGSIAINGIRITPAEYDDTITIDSIILKSSDPLMPVKGADIFKDGEFPEAFEVSLKRLEFDARMVEKLGKKQRKAIKELECRGLLTTVSMANAGYDRYDGDWRFKMDFTNVYDSKVYVDIFDQASTTSLEVTMDASQAVNVFTQGDSIPVTEVIFATELNEDAAQSIVDHCANVFKVSAETYLDKVVASKKYSENSFGVDLGSDLRQSLSKYLLGGSRYVVESTPSEQLKDLSKAKFYKSNDVLGWLNMVVSLDGVKIPVEIPEITAAEQEVLDQKENAPVVKKKEYVVVPVARVREYIGRKVRIKRTGDKPTIKGRMSGFADNRIAVDVYRHAGEMTLNVPVRDVAKLEVLE